MGDHPAHLADEQRARVLIDQQLAAAGWLVQDRAQLNLLAGPSVAVREAIMAPGHGRADYLLYLDERPVGVIEAKPEGTTLSGVEWQSAMSATGLPEAPRQRAVVVAGRLPTPATSSWRRCTGSSPTKSSRSSPPTSCVPSATRPE